MRELVTNLLRRLHDYLHRLDAEDHARVCTNVVSAPLVWPPFSEQGTAVQPPINFVVIPEHAPEWHYPGPDS
jgi:hypothetical protein